MIENSAVIIVLFMSDVNVIDSSLHSVIETVEGRIEHRVI